MHNSMLLILSVTSNCLHCFKTITHLQDNVVVPFVARNFCKYFSDSFSTQKYRCLGILISGR